MKESLDNFARFPDFCAKIELKNSTCDDLFPCACGERPSFDEFKEYCKTHLRLDLRNSRHANFMIILWSRLESCNWLTSKGKRPKSWKSLTDAYNGILLQTIPINKAKRNTEQYMPYYNIKTSDEEYPENGRHYVCYTDGSCDNVKSKAGGSAYIIIKDGEIVKMKSHGSLCTTNNRMELLAIISAVNSCPDNACVDVYTDSKYCIYVLSKETAPQINKDLYELYKKCSAHVEGIRFHWVRGHNGDKYNEMADDMAYGAYCDVCDEYHFKKMTRH